MVFPAYIPFIPMGGTNVIWKGTSLTKSFYCAKEPIVITRKIPKAINSFMMVT